MPGCKHSDTALSIFLIKGEWTYVTLCKNPACGKVKKIHRTLTPKEVVQLYAGKLHKREV